MFQLYSSPCKNDSFFNISLRVFSHDLDPKILNDFTKNLSSTSWMIWSVIHVYNTNTAGWDMNQGFWIHPSHQHSVYHHYHLKSKAVCKQYFLNGLDLCCDLSDFGRAFSLRWCSLKTAGKLYLPRVTVQCPTE